MNCLDCGLAVLGNGDRHRTGDNVLCHRVRGWEADARAMLRGETLSSSEIALHAAAWFVLNAAGGEDAAFDRWAKATLTNGTALLIEVHGVYQLVLHYEATLDAWAPDGLASRKATARREVVEAALNRYLGNDETSVEAALAAVECVAVLAAEAR